MKHQCYKCGGWFCDNADDDLNDKKACFCKEPTKGGKQVSDTIHPFSPLMEETLKQFHAVEIANNRTATEWDNVDAYTKEIYRREVYRNQAATLRTQLAEAQARIGVKDEALKDLLWLVQHATMKVQNHRSLHPTQLDALFQELYRRYQKYDVEHPEKLLSPTAGQSLLEEVKGLREALTKLASWPSSAYSGKQAMRDCASEALKKGGK